MAGTAGGSGGWPIVDVVVRFYETLWNRWDDDAVDGILAPDFRFRGSLGVATTGHAQWRGYRDMIRAGAPDFHNRIVEIVADGRKAAARLEYRGTHRGELAGFVATGRRFSYAGAAFFTMNGEGLLDEAWVLGDLAGLRAQLGHSDVSR